MHIRDVSEESIPRMFSRSNLVMVGVCDKRALLNSRTHSGAQMECATRPRGRKAQPQHVRYM